MIFSSFIGKVIQYTCVNVQMLVYFNFLFSTRPYLVKSEIGSLDARKNLDPRAWLEKKFWHENRPLFVPCTHFR